MDILSLPDTRPLPPTAEQLLAAIDMAVTIDDGLTILHLATPVDVVVPVSADRTDTSWRLRDVVIPDTGDILGDVLGLVLREHVDGMRYLDLSDPTGLARFVKVRRSGSRLVAFGPELLVGGPQLAAEPGVPPAALAAVLELWQDRPDIAQAGVVTLAGVPLIVEGDGRYLLLRQA